MNSLVEFFVPGIPRPGGSKRAFAIRKKNGSTGVSVTDMGGAQTMEWRAIVAGFAFMAMKGNAPYQRPLCLEVTFYMARPKNHFTARKLIREKNAADVPAKRPDLTKLVRALEDALTGVVWQDDSQIVQQRFLKTYCVAPGAKIVVSEAYRQNIEGPDMVKLMDVSLARTSGKCRDNAPTDTG